LLLGHVCLSARTAVRYVTSMPVKRCSECGLKKNVEEFGARSASRDGLRSHCKPCGKTRVAKYREEHPEKYAATQRRYLEKNRERLNAKSSAWNRANRSRVRANHQRCTRMASWMKFLATKSRHDAKRRGRDCDLTETDIRELFERQKGHCFWLGIELKPSLEPHDPQRPSVDRLDITRGYTRDNVVLACQFANMGRNVATAERFREFLVANRLVRQPGRR
jgi:hypothetical protein